MLWFTYTYILKSITALCFVVNRFTQLYCRTFFSCVSTMKSPLLFLKPLDFITFELDLRNWTSGQFLALNPHLIMSSTLSNNKQLLFFKCQIF